MYVQDQPVPLLYVGPKQINFLMSSLVSAGPVKIRVVTEGIAGPEITVTLADAAPALFSMAGGYAIATDSTGKLLTADAPAHARRYRGDLSDWAGQDFAEPGDGGNPQLCGLHGSVRLAESDVERRPG